MRSWYFVPQHFKELPKDALGITFSDGKFPLVAWQRDREVWFDDLLFSGDKKNNLLGMEISDQADAILHEIVMTTYLLKFKTFREICHQYSFAVMSSKSTCPDDNSEFAEEYFTINFKNEKPRPLNDSDYQNIRNLVNFLKTKGAAIKADELARAFRWNDFGKIVEVFLPQASSAKPVEPSSAVVTIPAIAVEQILMEAGWLNQMPDQCSWIKTNKSEPCSWKYLGASDSSGVSNSNSNSTGVLFSSSLASTRRTLKIAGPDKTVRSYWIPNDLNILNWVPESYVELNSPNSMSKEKKYFVVHLFTEVKSTQALGSFARGLTMLVKLKDGAAKNNFDEKQNIKTELNSPYELVALISVPIVLTKVLANYWVQDNIGLAVCTADRPRATDSAFDTIVSYQTEFKLDTQRILKMIPGPQYSLRCLK